MEELNKDYNENTQPDLKKVGVENKNKATANPNDPLNRAPDNATINPHEAGINEEGLLTGIPSDNPNSTEYPLPSNEYQPGVDHQGNQELIDRYNINDRAHADSSKDDFIKTVSNARHSDGTTTGANSNETK